MIRQVLLAISIVALFAATAFAKEPEFKPTKGCVLTVGRQVVEEGLLTHSVREAYEPLPRFDRANWSEEECSANAIKLARTIPLPGFVYRQYTDSKGDHTWGKVDIGSDGRFADREQRKYPPQDSIPCLYSVQDGAGDVVLKGNEVVLDPTQCEGTAAARAKEFKKQRGVTSEANDDFQTEFLAEESFLSRWRPVK